jgi:hypothetical protein
MSPTTKRDGPDPAAKRYVVTAKEIARGLGLGGPDDLKQPGPEDGRPLKSPAQVAAEERGAPVPPDAPGFTRTVVPGGRDAWEFYGRPAEANRKNGDTNVLRDGPIDPQFISREDEEREEKARKAAQRAAEQAARDLEREEPDDEAVQDRQKRWEAIHSLAARHAAERARKAADEARKAAALRSVLKDAGL